MLKFVTALSAVQLWGGFSSALRPPQAPATVNPVVVAQQALIQLLDQEGAQVH